MKRLVAIFALSIAALAQAPQPVTTPQLIVPVTTVQPSPALGASFKIVGNPGHSTYYYWIVDNYQVGNAVAAGPFMIQQAPDVLSGSNYVAVYPSLPGDQASFDVLRTASPIAPSGACNCAVATAQSAGPVNDQSNSLSSYTVTIANLAALSLALTNEVQGAGISHLILRQAPGGAVVADLSAALTGAYLPLQPLTTTIIQGTSPTVNVGFACGVGAANNQNCFQVLNSSLTNLLSLTNGGQLTLGTGSGGSFNTGTVTNNQTIFPEMAAPSNPLSGNELLYADIAAHTLKCLTSTGSSCMPAGGVSNIATTAPLAGGPITTTGTISITGLAGGVLAGSGPAFTATPVLGVAGTTVGSIGFQNATSGTVTLQPVTGALGTVTINIPAAAGTIAVSASSPLSLSATGQISITSPLPVGSGGTGIGSGTSGGVLAFTASGTIASSTTLGNNNLVIGGGAGAAPSTSSGLSSNGNAQLILGISGTSNGGVNFNNTTSGSILLAAVSGALGSNTISLPAATGTVAVSATSPITESAAGAIGCPTCATNSAQPTNAYFFGYTYNQNSFQNTTGTDPGHKGANVIQFILMHIPQQWTVNKISFRVDTPVAENVIFGFYDTSGNLVGDTGLWSINVNYGGGTLGTPITIPPGWYYYAWSGDTTNTTGTGMPSLIMQPLDGSDDMINRDATRWGTAQNAVSGGHMPATLGTLTKDNGVTGPLNCMFIE